MQKINTTKSNKRSKKARIDVKTTNVILIMTTPVIMARDY